MEFPQLAQTTLRDYNDYLIRTLEAQDVEKRAIMDRIDQVASAQELLGDIRGQLLTRSQELHNCQRALVDTKAALGEEREKTSRLIAENQTYQATLLEERAKVHTLLAMRKAELEGPTSASKISALGHTSGMIAPLTGRSPVLVSIPHKRTPSGHQPTVIAHTLSLRQTAATPASADASSDVNPATVADSVSQSGSPPSMSMSSLPVNPNANATLIAHLSDEVRTLKTLLDDQRSAFDHERVIRSTDERARSQEHAAMLEKLSRTIDHLQRQVAVSTKEVVESRHQWQGGERRLLAEIESLTCRLTEAEGLLDAQRARHTDDLRSAVDAQRSQHQDVTSRLREAASEREDRHVSKMLQYEARIAELEKRLQTTAGELERERRIRLRVEQQSRANEEGHQSDILLLKQQLRRIEKRLYFTSKKDEAETSAAVAAAGGELTNNTSLASSGGAPAPRAGSRPPAARAR